MLSNNVSGSLKTASAESQDAALDRLTDPTYDPVQYLNESLSALTLSSQTAAGPRQNRSLLLQNASTETQDLLSRLNAHNIRSSAELTNLTDDILRSANRLTYEVEVLRGDANNLYEILTDALKSDISEFVTQESERQITEVIEHSNGTNEESHPHSEAVLTNRSSGDPEFIRQLRILGLIKSRLEAVIAIFGEAMKWPIASSEVTGTSSLISVSAPELGVVTSAEDDRAREYAKRLRFEITELLDSNGGGQAGLQAATKRVNSLKELVQVWKDTTEEKARIRIVDGFSKTVEDRKKLLDSRSASSRQNTEGSVNRSSSMPGRAGRIVEGSTNTAAGLFRKLRDEIYLDGN